jgi:hypothetical protein
MQGLACTGLLMTASAHAAVRPDAISNSLLAAVEEHLTM